MFLNPRRLAPSTVPVFYDDARYVYLFGRYRKVGKRKVLECLHWLRYRKDDRAVEFVNIGDLVTPNGKNVYLFDGEEFMELGHHRPPVQHCRFCPCRLLRR